MSNTEKNPERPSAPKHRSTGPTTPQGKARSSLNRLTHGCRSEQIIIPGEDPAEFESTVQTWLDTYQPQNPAAETLVLETAHAHWLLARNQKWFHQVASRLPADAWLWTEQHHKLIANVTRYKTTAERSFFRCFNALEAHYKRQDTRAAQAEKARALMARANLQWLTQQAEAAAHGLTATQKVEVLVNDLGDCVTTFVPTNAHIAALARSPHPPQFVTRYLVFNFGVPPAYDWTCPTPLQRREQSVGVQHFLLPDWLKQIEAEQLAPAGHLVPSPTALMLDPN